MAESVFMQAANVSTSTRSELTIGGAFYSLQKCKTNITKKGNGDRLFEEYIWVYVAPIILIFGFVGNLLTIAVMSRRRYAGTNVQVYLMALAVFDTLVLITGMIPEWLHNCRIVTFRDINPVTCAVEKLFAYVTGDTAIWVLCAFTVDRCVAVCLPLRRKDSCKPRHSVLVCTSLFAVALAKNVHVLWTRGPEYCRTVNNTTNLHKMCGFPGPQSASFENYVRPWIAVVSVSLLPFTILLVCNVLIIMQLRNAQRMRAAAQSSAEKGFRQTIIMCLSISFVFLFTTLPSIVLVIGRPYWKPSSDVPVPGYDVSKAVINQMTYVNHSINFWLYCLTGRAFRHELLIMLGWRKTGGPGGGSQPAGLNQLNQMAGGKQNQLRRSSQKLVGDNKMEMGKNASRESIDEL